MRKAEQVSWNHTPFASAYKTTLPVIAHLVPRWFKTRSALNSAQEGGDHLAITAHLHLAR